MTFVRCSDWETALSGYLASVANLPFKYGHHDCALFAAGAVKAMTGIDPMGSIRGKYRSIAGSVRAIKTFGVDTLEAAIDGLFAEKPIAFARRGDLVLFAGSVGVCVGADALFVTEEGMADGSIIAEGLSRITRIHWDKAWTVG